MNTITKFLWVFIFGSLCTSCADEMIYENSGDDNNDNVIRFSGVGQENAEPSSRGDITAQHTTGEEWINSAVIHHHGDSIWMHVTARENVGVSGVSTSRAIPMDNVTQFYVTATVGNSTLIDNEIAKKDNSVSGLTGCWSTDRTYYWPAEDVTFYAFPASDKSPDTGNGGILPGKDNVKMGKGKITFNYTVPEGDGTNAATIQPDIILATHTYNKSDVNSGKADIRFRHPLTGLCIKDGGNLTRDIEEITLSGIYGEGTCTFDGRYTDNRSSSLWDITSEEKKSYRQKISAETKCEFVIDFHNGSETGSENSTRETIKAICEPFMFMPQEPGDACLRIKFTDGNTSEIPLSKFFDNWEPGKIYFITFSATDSQYPPVENLQGALGNSIIQLNWDKPDENRRKDMPHIHWCGVRIEIIPKNNGGNGETKTKDRLYSENHHDKKYPDNDDALGIFFDDTEGINPYEYDEFECKVHALYYNDNDALETIHESVARTVILKSVYISSEKIAFYIPGNRNTDDPINVLLDDDDKAAAARFKRTFAQNGVFVNQSDFKDKKEQYGFNTVWFPCGVKLTGNQPDKSVVEKANTFIHEPENFKKPYLEFRDETEKLFTQDLSGYKGLYDDGEIKVFDGDYVTDKDKETLKDFYQKGGNLLLTTFAIDLIYDIGVITDNCWGSPDSDNPSYKYREEFLPHFSLFNEVKQPATWFLNTKQPHHPIFKGMFKIRPEEHPDFPENNLDIYGGDKLVIVGGIAGEEMFPMLSRDALTCENNNVVWDFNHQKGKTMQDMENNSNCSFIGTWGQLTAGNTDIGAVIEFYPGKTDTNNVKNKTHGRCICIGLGAYEFNNGLTFVPNVPVKNRYQSNIRLLTKNALEYLARTPHDNKSSLVTN